MNTIVCLVGVFLLICAPCAYSMQLNDTQQTKAVETANKIFQKKFKDGKLVFDGKLVEIAMELACGDLPKDMGIIVYSDAITEMKSCAANQDRVACVAKACKIKEITTHILCVVAALKAPEKAAEKPDEKPDDDKKSDTKVEATTAGAQKIIGFSLVVLILGVLNY